MPQGWDVETPPAFTACSSALHISSLPAPTAASQLLKGNLLAHVYHVHVHACVCAYTHMHAYPLIPFLRKTLTDTRLRGVSNLELTKYSVTIDPGGWRVWLILITM